MAAEQLTIRGGVPVRDTARKPWPKWPVWDHRDATALQRVLESGTWGSAATCTEVPAFAGEFARFHDARFCTCTANGTLSLEIALRAMDLRPGDEVVVPPYTFVATASSVVLAGAIPVFADIDPGTYNLDPTAAEAAVTCRTRGIIVVHIGGCPADMDGFTALARKHGLFLIEDAAQAHAAEWKGRKVGAIGDVGTFSFQSGKNLTAGEGGAIVTDQPELHDRCWSLVNVGRKPGGKFYQHLSIGTNCRMTEFQAALLRTGLARLPGQVQRRWENAAFLNHELQMVPGIRPQHLDPRATMHGYHLYILRLCAKEFGAERADLIRMLTAEGIPCSAGYPPLYRTRAFTTQENWPGPRPDYSSVDCPVTEHACEHEAIWLAQNMLLGSRADMQDVVDAVVKVHRCVTQ